MASDIPITVGGSSTKKEITITKKKGTAEETTIRTEPIELPDKNLKVTLTGVTGAEKCTDIVLPAGNSWTLTIG